MVHREKCTYIISMKVITSFRDWQLRHFSELIVLVKRAVSLVTEQHIKHTEYIYGINWMHYVHLIHVLCLGDLNYVSSVYWQTLRSFTIKYKQASTCSKSAKQTSEQDSKFVLIPKTDIITYQFNFETIR